MRKLILFCSVLFLSSCCNTAMYEQKISDLSKKIDSLNIEIVTSEETIDILREEIQMREGEISYWGNKLDSCMGIYEKK